MADSTENPSVHFSSLSLPASLEKVTAELGYEEATPIQARAIPVLLAGRDMIGQAQTGTGKTAAFALPVLSKLTSDPKTQALILTPTRELAIQVAEACQSYAKHLNKFTVLPIYGGQGFTQQLRQLKRGAQLVVGTPGRIMDHMRRGTLKLDHLQTLVLDEADEMLRMGFIDDVTWILEQTPDQRQIALFSATMPKAVKRVAETYLNNPEHIKIASKTSTAKTISQRYWLVQGLNKLDALTRILESEDYDGVIIFVRTKIATEELSNKLSARGLASAALHGDIPQNIREKTVDRLKRGQIDILVATDVVARGLDVERVSHVINYDVPYDTEAYVHRIGRTGRAGRNGDAILFIAHREKRMLHAIERATSQKLTRMSIPSASDINQKRIRDLKSNIQKSLEEDDLSFFQGVLSEFTRETQADPLAVAAALAHMGQGGQPLLLDTRADAGNFDSDRQSKRRNDKKRDANKPDRARHAQKGDAPKAGPIRPLKKHPEVILQRYCIDVGHEESITPSQVVGAIANTADLSSEFIGAIEIYNNVTTVDLPEGMPTAIKKQLAKTRLGNKPLVLRDFSESATESKPARSPRRGSKDSAKKSDSGGKRKPSSGSKKPSNENPKKKTYTKKPRKPKSADS